MSYQYKKTANDRISYYRGQSGEYYIVVDGKHYCSCDTIQEVEEEIAEISERLDKGEESTD